MKQNKLKSAFAAMAAGTVLAASNLHATAPLDLSATGTEVAGYIAGAAGAGVAILAAMYGIRVIIRAFKAVK
jgi:hypothetical protein